MMPEYARKALRRPLYNALLKIVMEKYKLTIPPTEEHRKRVGPLYEGRMMLMALLYNKGWNEVEISLLTGYIPSRSKAILASHNVYASKHPEYVIKYDDVEKKFEEVKKKFV